MNEKINIKKMDGTTVAADLVCYIENTTTNKRYVYYTLNEIVGTGDSSTVKIYVSKLQQNNPALDTPITEEDWNKLKGYMGDALKGNTNAEVKYIPLSELGEPVSISEKAIAMPVSYDYINKQRGVYASNVATAEPAPVVPPAPEVTVAPEAQASVAEPAPITPEPTPVTETISEAPEVAAPLIEEPAVREVATPEPATPVAPTPVEAPIPEPTFAPEIAPAVTPAIETTSDTEEGTNTSATLTPIDLATIEQKYSEMIETINRLKEQELEAAKRYNATIELSSMHKEQHASYVQNEQIKESATEPQVTPEIPTVAPVAVEPSAPVTQEITVGGSVPTQVPVTPEPVVVPETPATPAIDLGSNPVPMTGTPIEPVPVTPVVPEPAQTSPVDIETNWFDMPANNAQ